MRNPSRLLAALSVGAAALTLGAGTAAADERPVPGPGVSVAAGAPPLPHGITGTSFLVADLDTGAILAAKDAHHPLLPASTLKVLTGLTLIPRVPRYSTVIPTFDDVNIEGSRVGIVENQKYPAYQIFRAMLMVSGNDAANAAATAAGGEAPTAALMNEEARRIGAFDTHAVNPSGLDAPGQKTTAYDLALIGRAAMQLPDFRAYVATKYSTINGKGGHPLRISTHDKLLYNYDGAIGIKNGYTVRAGATFIGAATRDGHSIIVTDLHATPRVWPEVAHLLDWGFAAEKAGAVPLGKLADPPGGAQPLPGQPEARRVRPVAAHLRSSTGIPSAPIGLAVVAAGLAAVAVRRRFGRRPARRPLPR
jgi:D-alanyl-D-alanine carboxypeptidase (penicillin-binding protein 5/6)